jgi:ribonuclease HI
MKIYFDGGSKPNPGKMEAGIVMVHDDGYRQPIKDDRLGMGTNNVAEWTALIWAMTWAEQQGWSHIEIFGDSQLIINQAQGNWRIKQPEFVPFRDEFQRLQRTVKATLTYVPRAQNLAGIYLEHGRC